MQPLDQNEAVLVRPNENGSLLSDLQNTFGDFLNEIRLESFLPLHGNVDLVDWKAFRLGHSFDSVVTEPIRSTWQRWQDFRDEALHCQGNSWSPVAGLIYSSRYALVADDASGALARYGRATQKSSLRLLIHSLLSIS